MISERMSIMLRAAAIVSLVVILAVVLTLVPQSTKVIKADTTVYFFHGAECSHCHDIMPFMNATIKKYPNIKFEVLEVWHNETNNKLAVAMNNRLSKTNWGVPEVIIGDEIMIGSKDISENLESMLNNITVSGKNV